MFAPTLLVLGALLATGPVLAQEVYAVPTDGSTVTISACSGLIVDDGLADGPYTDGGRGTLRIYPDVAGRTPHLTVVGLDVAESDLLRIGFSPTTEILVKDVGLDALATPHRDVLFPALGAEEDYLEVRFDSVVDGNGGDGFEIEIACVEVEAFAIGPATSTTSCGVDTTDSGGVDGDYGNDEGHGVTFESVGRRRLAVHLQNYSITAPDQLSIHLGPGRTLEIDGDGSSPPYDTDSLHFGDEGASVNMAFISDASEVAAGWEAHVFCYDLIDESSRSVRGGNSPLEPRAFIAPLLDDNGSFLPNQSTSREFAAPSEDLDLVVYLDDHFEGPEDRLDVRSGSGNLLGTVEFGSGDTRFLVPNETGGRATVRFEFVSNDDGLEGLVSARVEEALVLNAARDGSTVETCGLYVYDSGGLTGGVGLNEDYTLTLQPRNRAALIDFLINHDLQDGVDVLRVFDGDSTSGRLLREFTGSGFRNVLGTEPGRAVTLQVVSDASEGAVPAFGWYAFASCNLKAIFFDDFELGATTNWSP